MKLKLNIFLLFCLAGLIACQTYETLPPPPPPPAIQEPPAKVFSPVKEDSQIPEDRLKEASRRYDGALTTSSPTPASQPEARVPVPASPAAGDNRHSLVLGPIVCENSPAGNRNAGQGLREAIARELTSNRDIQLIDAPEERYKNDSPRPDLARRGIRYVVKGVASFSQKSGKTTVFLRAVNTSSGEVAAVASGRHTDPNQAAGDAARGLMQKLED
jgi:TolB-like protein